MESERSGAAGVVGGKSRACPGLGGREPRGRTGRAVGTSREHGTVRTRSRPEMTKMFDDTTTATTAAAAAVPRMQAAATFAQKSPVMALFAVGVLGNLLALFVLTRARRAGNERHAFLLRCLATNDGVGLAGMLAVIVASVCWPHIRNELWTCRLLALWRFFGLGSGCVAVAMAVERWLALTRPSFYRTNITCDVLKRTVFKLWFGIFCLVCAPLFGFGIYYEEGADKCSRVRDAKEPLDVLYAYLHFSIGMIFCITIAYTNLDVVRVLCTKKSTFNNLNKFNSVKCMSNGRTTASVRKEEKGFTWIALSLCVFFVLCWIPQMVSIPLTNFVQDQGRIKPFYRIADILLAVHFTVDPFVYVVQQWMRTTNVEIINNNNSSARTSCNASLLQSI